LRHHAHRDRRCSGAQPEKHQISLKIARTCSYHTR
jgi:hypothetical protein